MTWRVTPEQLVPAMRLSAARVADAFRRFEFACGDRQPARAARATAWSTTVSALEPGKPQVQLAVDLGADNPRVPTVTGVYPAADWYEREAWDMMGVRVDGHPDLRRLYMPDCWDGHPLRKDHIRTAAPRCRR
mgnify:CR=1 FL=1